MANVSKRNRRREKDRQTAAKNRRELIAAGFNRRDMMKMGLLTSASMLIPKKGLSAHPLTSAGFAFDDPQSPATTPFVENIAALASPRASEFVDPGANYCVEYRRRGSPARFRIRLSPSSLPRGKSTSPRCCA